MILALGPVPTSEPCVQVSSADYLPAMREECRRYKAMLEQRFPNRTPDCRFRITSNPHDFGTYLEVEVIGPEEAVEFIDANLPETWDDQEIFLDKL